MALVANQTEVSHDKIIDAGLAAILDVKCRQRIWGSSQLFFALGDSIQINVPIGYGVNKVPGLQPGYLGHHMQQ